jgi:regulator of sirC expression with transglutaminase-like and TPR domain
MAAYDRAIAIKPENAEAWRDRGAVVSELKQDTDKIDSGESDIINASDSKVKQPKSADSM